MPSFRLAGGMAAAVAILALVASSAYLYGTSRATPSAPGTGGSPSVSAGTSARTTTGSPPSITPVAGTGWQMASGVLPQLASDGGTYPYRSPVFALGADGFVAFVPTAKGVSRGSQARPGALAAPVQSSDPTAPATPYEIRVYTSADGLSWRQVAVLPGDGATVRSMVYSGGRVVVVGSVSDLAAKSETPTAWSSTDLASWDVTRMPAPEHTGAYGVAAGTSGFLAYGQSLTDTVFWTSPNGIDWTRISTTGLPADFPGDELYAVPGGYAIRGFDKDRAAVWQSSDGATWKETWTGPAPSGIEFYALGKPLKAAGGGYVSFGAAGSGGGPAAEPLDIVIWAGTDLIHWTVAARVKSPGWIADYAAVSGGYVAAAAQPASLDAGAVPWGSLGVWTSADGKSLTSVKGLPSIPGIAVLSVVSDGTHAVVVCADQDGHIQLLVGTGLE